ncbi:hypothetical protein CRI94_15600 [Longibacter salinarum]|uniref:SHOCT domain-containing protein n=1 Tax=Longibacter salinarum TaxID=1850348 RepID=A0A2A8CUS6_9BACT|nr:SHOCT domain-containing protein [Longibacter salinarum]PEN11497.1 hypothetical protein CRI94_15600 [Longibacter salinarum]
MFDGSHIMWGMHGFWWIFWILLIGLAIWTFVRRPGADSISTSSDETPLERLQKRYADGEISTEEYEDRKERLERDR